LRLLPATNAGGKAFVVGSLVDLTNARLMSPRSVLM